MLLRRASVMAGSVTMLSEEASVWTYSPFSTRVMMLRKPTSSL